MLTILLNRKQQNCTTSQVATTKRINYKKEAMTNYIQGLTMPLKISRLKKTNTLF